jgi:hypothetical protein
VLIEYPVVDQRECLTEMAKDVEDIPGAGNLNIGLPPCVVPEMARQ